MWGNCVPFSAFFSTVETKIAPVMAYSFKLPKFIFSKNYPFKPQISVRLARMCAHYTSYTHVFQLTQFQRVFALIHWHSKETHELTKETIHAYTDLPQERRHPQAPVCDLPKWQPSQESRHSTRVVFGEELRWSSMVAPFIHKDQKPDILPNTMFTWYLFQVNKDWFHHDSKCGSEMNSSCTENPGCCPCLRQRQLNSTHYTKPGTQLKFSSLSSSCTQ